MRFFSVHSTLEWQIGNESTIWTGGKDEQPALYGPVTAPPPLTAPPGSLLLVQLRPLGLFALFLCICFCVLANLLTLFLLLRCRPLQHSSRTTNLYVLSLCLADLGVGCVAMPLALTQEWISDFHPEWLCQTWQLADLFFSTVSLYSICAIALDRVWNLEQPLRVFTRSRRSAKRLMLCIWLLPLLVWLPVYICLRMPIAQTGSCYPPKELAKRVYWVALPALYIPAAILIGLFLRISFVVHSHLKFLREHSSQPQPGPSPQMPISAASLQPFVPQNGRSATSQTGRLLRTPGSTSPQFRTTRTFENISNTICGTNGQVYLRNPRGNSPLGPSRSGQRMWRERAATSEEVMAQWRKSPTILVHGDEEQEEKTGKKEENNSTVEEEEQRKSSDFMTVHQQKVSLSSRPSIGSCSDNSSLSSSDKKECLLRKLSASFLTRRGSTSRFSMVAFSENLAELLQREGISQQVKAAKAIGLIMCCFLLCWFPFLLIWPIRLFSPESISDRSFRLCLWLNYACSTFNPLLYALSNPKVRAAFRKNLFGCKLLLARDGAGSGKNTRRSNTAVFV